MFDNIGGKIKILAQIFVWIGIIASVILGIILCNTDVEWLGVICIFLGPILCWISSMTLYGFGELIENSLEIKNSVSEIKKFASKIPYDGLKQAYPYQSPSKTPKRLIEKNPTITNKYEKTKSENISAEQIADKMSDIFK